jgi:uncharacterized protein
MERCKWIMPVQSTYGKSYYEYEEKFVSLTLDDNHAAYQIRAYQPGSIQINDQILHKSLIVTPNKLIQDWPPQTFSELSSEHLAIIIDLSPAIVLIGTGSTIQFPNAAIYGDLINAGIGVEIMDTHAACRTYNALTAEDRNVVAALVIK